MAPLANQMEGKMPEPLKRSHIKREAAQARAYSQAVITEGGRTIWLAGQVDTIRKIEAVNPTLNAVIYKTYDRARQRTATRRKARALPRPGARRPALSRQPPG